jgi:CheY-like chemotaxis protein
VFTIEFPRTYAMPLPPPQQHHVEPLRARATVLVVDDEPLVRSGARRILERRGLTVLEACNGEEALAVFEAHVASIGLVILDMGMPVMGRD